jgi:hypothetical protein
VISGYHSGPFYPSRSLKLKSFVLNLALLRKYLLSEFLSIPLGEESLEMVDLEIIQPCRDV